MKETLKDALRMQAQMRWRGVVELSPVSAD
jgi:hypothetical protein